MAIGPVVTWGFGPGDVNDIPVFGFTSSAVVIISGPFCVEKIDAYTAGAVTADSYSAGAVKADSYQAGAVIAEGTC